MRRRSHGTRSGSSSNRTCQTSDTRSLNGGASGSALEFAVEVLNSVAVETVMLGARYAIARIRGRKDSSSSAILETAEQLKHAAIEAASSISEVDSDDLEVVALQIDQQTATISQEPMVVVSARR